MKQTEIGLIPDDWEVKRLGDVAFLKTGKTIDFSATKEGIYPCYGGNGIRAYIPFYSHDGAFPIIGRQGELCGNVQYADGKFYATEHAVVCTPNNNVDSKWLYFQLIKADINKYKTGNAQPGISVDKINSEVFIPFPPIAEQQRIAKALSDVDALISTTEKLLQKKKNIKQGAMQELLTGKKRLPGFAKSPAYKQTELGPIPEDWEVKEFKQEATLINGRAYAQSELLKQGKYKVLRVGNFGTNDTWYYSDLELPENQYCKKGDLLYCWSCTYGAYIWNEEKTIYHYHIWKIIPKGADKEYLKYILNNDTENQMKSSNGSTMSHITKGFLENRVFIFPPLAEQQQIANVLSSMDKEIETLNTKLEKYRNLKTAMMQQLLTGKIRLV